MIVLGMNVIQALPPGGVREGLWPSDEAKSTQVGLVRVPKGGAHLPAGSICAVEVIGRDRSFSSDEQLVIEQSREVEGHCLVLPTVVRGKAPWKVMMANTGTEDVFLPGRIPVGTIHPIAGFQTGIEIEEGEQEVIVHCGKVQVSTAGVTPVAVDLSKAECSTEERKKLSDALEEFSDMWTKDYETDVGYTEWAKHQVPLVDEAPVVQAYRRIPPTQLEEVKQHLQGLIDKDIIQPSKSAFAAPLVIVRKKDGSIRLCVDYRKLNSKTRRDAYPLPRIEESLDALKGATLFTTLDLASGYHQVAMEEKDRHRTAFHSPLGLYEFKRMPFGLTSAPATFQRLMQTGLNEMIFQILLVYLDDVLVYSQTFDEHLDRLRQVLSRLKEMGLKLNSNKCHFCLRTVQYLGHTISAQG